MAKETEAEKAAREERERKLREEMAKVDKHEPKDALPQIRGRIKAGKEKIKKLGGKKRRG